VLFFPEKGQKSLSYLVTVHYFPPVWILMK
jgi:hypothetical protein